MVMNVDWVCLAGLYSTPATAHAFYQPQSVNFAEHLSGFPGVSTKNREAFQIRITFRRILGVSLRAGTGDDKLKVLFILPIKKMVTPDRRISNFQTENYLMMPNKIGDTDSGRR
jgi:hypothetical protein